MQKLIYYLAKGFVLFLQALPLPVVARIGRFVGALAYLHDARHRRVARGNLRRAFPNFSEEKIRSIARENFRRLGENYASAIKTSSMPVDELRAVCEVVGAEKLAPPAGSPSKNCIVAIGHFGNFELYTIL